VAIVLACIVFTIALQSLVFMRRRRDTSSATRRPREMSAEKPGR